MNSSLPTGTVTFLFTDIENSTGLAQQYPDDLPALLTQHHAILRQSIEAQHGQIFQIVGDGVCAAFFTATDALLAALQAQRQLQQADWHPVEIKVRMGVHTGPAQAGSIEDETGVYTGYLTLTRTQRIMSAAYGGQVLISKTAAELVRGELPKDVELLEMGEHWLKGLSQTEHLFQTIAPGLQSEFPPLSTMSAPRHNLPGNLSPFIGREKEISHLKELLQDSRIVTLTGPGGVGKTRLCLKAAEDLLLRFPHGVWVVELAQLSEPTLVPQTIASVLGLREDPTRPLVDLIKNYLSSKRLLLYLDNCEHLIEICAQLVREIISASTEVQIMASSREALGISGEIPFLVPPLRVPAPGRLPNPGKLETYEAIQLFVKRASLVQPSFSVNSQNSAAVAQICIRLDGIPLAIELAAARIKALSPEQIAARLDDRFRLLTGGSRSALPRQQTLKALIDWSYHLLTEPERILFSRLSAFIGGWTLEAAEAVCTGEDVQMDKILDLLTSLIEKSLIIKREEFGEARFRRLETIREYARNRFLESGEEASVRDRHKEWFLQFAEAAFQHFGGPEEPTWLDKLEVEHDNLRAALEWSLISHDLETAATLCDALVPFWDIHGHVTEARRWLKAIIGSADPLSKNMRARILYRAAGRAEGQGDYDEALTFVRESRNLYLELGDQEGLIQSIKGLGYIMFFSGDFENAIQTYNEALALAQQIDHKGLIEKILDDLVMADVLQGNYKSATESLEERLPTYRDQKNERWVACALYWLGQSMLMQGEYLRADKKFRECLVFFHRSGDGIFVSLCQIGLAGIALERGQPVHAARLLGASEFLRESFGAFISPRIRQAAKIDHFRSTAREQLGEAKFSTAWEEGQAIAAEGLHEIAEYALKES